MRGNPYVELAHWVHILLQDAQNDIASIRTAFGLNDAQIAKDVVAALDGLPRGATSISDFCAPDRGSDREGLALRLAAVRRRPRPHRPSAVRDAQDADAAERAVRAVGRIRKVQVEKLGDEFDTATKQSGEVTQAR